MFRVGILSSRFETVKPSVFETIRDFYLKFLSLEESEWNNQADQYNHHHHADSPVVSLDRHVWIGESVITSYSIHYTKLYDVGYWKPTHPAAYWAGCENLPGCRRTGWLVSGWSACCPRACLVWKTYGFSWGQSQKWNTVITSYSIHYTKLYDIEIRANVKAPSTNPKPAGVGDTR